jgi:hypothetical protein
LRFVSASNERAMSRVHSLLTTNVIPLGDSVRGTEVALRESMRINNKEQVNLSPGLLDPVFVSPQNAIFWRPRCTDSPVP